MNSTDCCVLNGGDGAWAFEAFARQLAAALWVDVSPTPRRLNYLLTTDRSSLPAERESFIPIRSVEIAADKRRQAEIFVEHAVPIPETHLLDHWSEVQRFRALRPEASWCLKYPTACGASGHRMLTTDFTPPEWWPRPFVVQEFVPLARPEVYRTYAAGGAVFGWVVRRFPVGAKASPWVAHARGARYERAGVAPFAAADAARAALTATGLLASFGCADLIQKPTGEWLVLEIGTDGLVNHVDRDLSDPDLEREIQRRVANAFWARVGPPPWGTEWYAREGAV